MNQSDNPRVEPSVSEPARPDLCECRHRRVQHDADGCDFCLCPSFKPKPEPVTAPQPTPHQHDATCYKPRNNFNGDTFAYLICDKAPQSTPEPPRMSEDEKIEHVMSKWGGVMERLADGAAPQGVGKLKIAGRGEPAEDRSRNSAASTDLTFDTPPLSNNERPAKDSVEGVGKLPPEPAQDSGGSSYEVRKRNGAAQNTRGPAGSAEILAPSPVEGQSVPPEETAYVPYQPRCEVCHGWHNVADCGWKKVAPAQYASRVQELHSFDHFKLSPEGQRIIQASQQGDNLESKLVDAYVAAQSTNPKGGVEGVGQTALDYWKAEAVYWQGRYGKSWEETLTLRAELQQAQEELRAVREHFKDIVNYREGQE